MNPFIFAAERIIMKRWIIHIDMDAFYAAVEQRDNPDLRGKPVIIGGIGRRGVVSTASYEARRFGVHSAMPMSEARRLCPQGEFMAGDHHKYARVAAEIRRILAEFSPLIEPLSLDEAFLDVTGMEWLWPEPREIAATIKKRIKADLSLIASAGVAPNKFLAKLASDWGKPDGLVVIEHGTEQEFLRNIPVTRLWGVGETAARLLQGIGINTIGQLAAADQATIEQHFGNTAAVMLKLAQGHDNRPVVADQAPKSIGNEVTFAQDLRTREDAEVNLLALAAKVGRRIRRHGYSGRTITIKVRFGSFKTITRSRTLSDATFLDDTIYKTATSLFAGVQLQEGIRLLGITVSNLHLGAGQTGLFSDAEDKLAKVSSAVDRLKDRFGEGAVTRGRLLALKSQLTDPDG
jgi:DNA polymerase-4